MNISEPNNTEKKRPRSFFDSKEANNDDSKVRQENGVEDLNNLQQIKELPAQVQPSADDRMKQLFELRAEKPVYDPQRPEELRRLARQSAIGKALSLIGDNIALAKNANVNRARPDNSEEEYQNKVYDYMDDYQRRLDTWNWRDFTNKLRNIQTAQDQGNWQKSFDQRQANADRNFAYNSAKDERDYLTDQDRFNRQMELNDEKFKQSAAYQQMTAEERERHNRQMEAASMLRAQRTGSSTKEPFKLFDEEGKAIELEGSEREKVLSMILGDTQLEKKDLDLLGPKMGEPVSTNVINLLVQKYWQKSPAVRNYMQGKYNTGAEKEWRMPEIWGGTSNTQTAKPKEKTTIDYSTLNY